MPVACRHPGAVELFRITVESLWTHPLCSRGRTSRRGPAVRGRMPIAARPRTRDQRDDMLGGLLVDRVASSLWRRAPVTTKPETPAILYEFG